MTSEAAARRPGRRPGNSGARDDILASARELFAANGFDKTTVRAVAAGAGVDPALVHHYFGTKLQLFTASIALPVDPRDVLAPVYAAAPEDLGRALVTALLGVWDSPHRDAAVAMFRAQIAGGDSGLIRSFLLEVALAPLFERIDRPAGTGRLRAELVATQMTGIMLVRYIIGLEPLASMPSEQLVQIVAPTVQHYLTGDLPGM
ncbi:TetR/AcrR family transcriptional regulator [Rhodococcus rhodochrous]|uniref:TetR/AcrR family transcriptional regulator n=1 Tax=Rhodococcus rhodochrous TaxID=1829 RepID=UPI00132ED366|nr:TetR family transcriptional regulator [Rhodococcus rhodochrous]QHG84464.1 TetR/AcrR family transcriptional regulator [Rhodococcus rhodochrous]QOH55798.1 TetR family transcriptional regulator [Rhodococcus rhodochrous]